MRKLFLLPFFLCVFITVNGQVSLVTCEQYSVQQGLTDQFVQCIMQDRTGFLWIGGGNGIYRFDGYDFTYFQYPPGCISCSPFSQVYSIVEDDFGLLWILSQSGIYLFDPKIEKSLTVYRFGSDHNSSYLYSDKMGLLKDAKGRIWATNGVGLIEFCYKSGKTNNEMLLAKTISEILTMKFIHLSHEISSEKNIAQKIYEDGQRNIWVGCQDGLFVMRNHDSLFYRIDLDQKLFKNTKPYIWDILQQNEDTFWIINSSNYRLTNIKKALSGKIPDGTVIEYTSYPLPDGQTGYCLYKDKGQRIYISSEINLFRLSGSNPNPDHAFGTLYSKLPDQNSNKTYKYIHCILEDKTGTLWTTNYFYGLLKIRKEVSKFKSYEKKISQFFSNTDINHIIKDYERNLWIGVYGGGLYKIQEGTGKVTGFDLGKPGNNIICMAEISPGFIWVGLNGGILEFDMNRKKVNNLFQEDSIAKYLRSAEVYDILKDGNLVYLATTRGLFTYDLPKKILSRFSFTDNDSTPADRNRFLSPIKRNNGKIIVGTSYDGIFEVSYNAETWKISMVNVITDSLLDIQNISLAARYRLFEDSRGTLWIVNKTGLFRINPELTGMLRYKLFDNIKFPEIWSITEDAHENLWLGTQYGLCKFNIKTGNVNNYAADEGLPFTLHQYNTVYKDSDGQLYFGGIGGFYSFYPDSLPINNAIPTIVITDFRLFNKSVQVDDQNSTILKNAIAYTHSVELRHNQNDISFKFAALDYNQPLKNNYKYKLEEYQDEWVETGAGNRIATYTNLDPGTYLFRVKGSNNDGIWNEDGTSLTVFIRKPWWATTVAYISYILLFIAALGSYIRLRLLSLKKEKSALEKLVHVRTRLIEDQKELLELKNRQITELHELKSRFFANVSHEFRTPLSLIQSPIEELLGDSGSNDKQKRKLNMVYRNARRLLDLVNQLLDISRIDDCKLKIELVEEDVMKHLQVITGTFNPLAERKGINYQCNFPAEAIISWFDPDKVEKISSNLLSNAFKFTPESGEIEFKARYIYRDDQQMPLYLEFIVKDNGPGIPSGSLEKIFDRFYQVEESLKTTGGGTGIGLSLARDIARLLHGDITVESKQGTGSAFCVQLPLGKGHLKDTEYIVLNIPAGKIAPKLFYEDACHEIKEENPGSEQSDQKPIILIVEDNRDIRTQLADNLNQEYLICEAVDGLGGLKKAFEIIPDLILTDVMMPRMDGIEFCDRLKNDERTSHIPVIMLTARATVDDKLSGLLTGADDYISKPFNMAELIVRVENLIEQRKKLRERFGREITLEPSDINITSIDEQFLKRAIETVEKHFSDEEFDLTGFKEAMHMSRSTLFRKLQALTDQSPTEFIRTIRLKRAASLLKQHFGSVTQISLEVGFNNLSYFNRSFKKMYGVSPVEYVKST